MVVSQNKTKQFLLVSVAVGLIGCSTSITERSPIDFASNAVRHTDTYSGVSEVRAPQIKAFTSNRTSLKGHVQLRTAGPFTDSKGVVQKNGAYLEIVLDYATATPDPEGGLYFDQVRWAGGEAAELADFGATVLDCREDVREIYRVPIGYVGYGHRGGHYGQYGRHGYGGYGYGRHGRRGGHYGGYGRRGGDHHGGENNDNSGNDNNNGTTSGGDGNVDTTQIPRRRDTVGSGRRELPPSAKQPRWRVPTSTIKEEMSARANRPAASAPVSRPNPPKVTRSTPPPPPPPPPARRQSSSPKNTARSVDRVFRNTDNSRTRPRHKIDKQMRYDPYSRPSSGYSDYVVDYSCQRQESLRVFIPRERLLAAEKNGLLLYVNPRNGIEETIVLPPNYISGFLLAAYSPEGQQLTIEGEPKPLGNQASQSGSPVPKTKPSARTPIIYGGD